MSDRIHCDHCDATIPPDIWRLTLHCGIQRGDYGHEETEERDYCMACVESIPLLREIYEDQFEQEPDDVQVEPKADAPAAEGEQG